MLPGTLTKDINCSVRMFISVFRTDMFIHGEVIKPFRIVSAAELLR